MARAHLKTKAEDGDPKTFLASVVPEQRRCDGFELLDLFNEATGLTPRLWGTSIVGYGRYAYTYESGRSGEYFMTGFSPRKGQLSIYILPGYLDLDTMRARLGPHTAGKSCLYIKSLKEIDRAVLAEIITFGLAELRRHYDTWDD